MISSLLWTPYFRNKHIPYKSHCYFSSISISFPYFLSRSAWKMGNILNATGTGLEVKDVMQVMDVKAF